VQGLLRSFGAIDRLRLDRAINFLAVFQGRGQTLAKISDLFTIRADDILARWNNDGGNSETRTFRSISLP